jgi:hypothetical protein
MLRQNPRRLYRHHANARRFRETDEFHGTGGLRLFSGSV